MNTTTQRAMIDAARKIAALMPPKPARVLMAPRTEQLVYNVHELAAKAAYRRAAVECATIALSTGTDDNHLHARCMAEIHDDSRTLAELVEMCEPGYSWGGTATTQA